METDIILGLCGLAGGLLTSAGDMLLDLKGKDNVSSGKYGFLDSAWNRMDIRRFQWSILLAMVGAPLIFLGMTAMARQLMLKNQAFGQWFFYVSALGSCGAFFIHTSVCLFPILYKTVTGFGTAQQAETVINRVYESIRIPFWIFYGLFVAVPAILLIVALGMGYLNLSRWYILLTAPVLVGVSILLKILKQDWFCDLPFAIAPSLSMSMIGLMAVLNLL